MGSGKSTLIHLLAAGYGATGRSCGNSDPGIPLTRGEALGLWPNAEVIFLECQDMADVTAERGDQVIILGLVH